MEDIKDRRKENKPSGREGEIEMKKFMNGKMSAQELDVVAGGMGYCYWAKDGDKYNYVMATRPLSREEIIHAWNNNGQLPLKADANGNVQSQSVFIGRGLKEQYLSEFVKNNEQRFGGCQYTEFK